MTNSSTHNDLSQQIEQLVQAHLVAVRGEAEAAVARAFASAGPTSRAKAKTKRPETGRKRRSREELEVLGERLLEVVVQSPGASMVSLAAQLDLSPRELQRPMKLLKSTRRVRSVGQRHLTRYFPLASKPHAASG